MGLIIKSGSIIFMSLIMIVLSDCPIIKHPNQYNTNIQIIPPDFFKNISTIYQDQSLVYWINNPNYGLLRYDTLGMQLFTQVEGLSCTNILNIQEDKQGTLFIECFDAVCRFNGKDFEILPIQAMGPYPSGWNLTENDLWFSMGWFNNGPYRYHDNKLLQLQFPHSEKYTEFKAQNPAAGYNPFGIYAIYEDRNDVQWFGTASLGIGRYDGQHFAWMYEDQLTHTVSGGDFGIRSMIQDSDGYFWFCNTKHKYHIDGNQMDTTSHALSYSALPGLHQFEELSDKYFMSLQIDSSGSLWMLSYDEGVYVYNGFDLQHIPIQSNQTKTLCKSMYIDRMQNVWIISHKEGLLRYDNGEFVPFKLEK